VSDLRDSSSFRQETELAITRAVNALSSCTDSLLTIAVRSTTPIAATDVNPCALDLVLIHQPWGSSHAPGVGRDDGCAIIPRRIALLLLVGETTLAASARGGERCTFAKSLRLVATAGSFGVRQSTAAFLPTIGTSFPICTGDKAAISRRTPKVRKNVVALRK
jgi:hypothetical protein